MSMDLRKAARRFTAHRRAVTSIEYALLASLIAVVIIGAVTTLGGNIGATFNSVSSELSSGSGNTSTPPPLTCSTGLKCG